jgi:hypothetical protein
MSQPVLRIFVGTHGEAMRRAEIALAYSVKKHCTVPYEIIWMDASRDDERYHNWVGGGKDFPWYTPFTNFRFSIPEYSNFEGRSIYLDVDQLFLNDPNILLNLPIPEGKAYLSLTPHRTDVILYDNEKFKDSWYPSIDVLKKTKRHIGHLNNIIAPYWAELPWHWCCNDGGVPNKQGFQTLEYDEEKTNLIHYTEMNWQPWHPYPDGNPLTGRKFSYGRHPHQEVTRIFWEYYAKGLEEIADTIGYDSKTHQYVSEYSKYES